MSLEAAITELANAVKVQTEETRKLVEVSTNLLNLRANAIETVKGAAAPAAASKKADKAAEKPAEKPAEKAAEDTKANISTSPEDRQDPAQADANAGPSHDTVKELMTKYLSVDDADQRLARRNKVIEMFGKIGEKGGSEVKVHTDIPANFLPAACTTLENLIAKGDIELPKKEGDDLLG